MSTTNSPSPAQRGRDGEGAPHPGPQGPDGKTTPSTDGAWNGPKIIPVDELRKGGTRFVRLLDRPTLEWIVGRAVAAATRVPVAPTLDARSRQAAIQAAAREEVRRALKQEQWLAPEEEAARRKRNGLEKAVVRLREELGNTVLRLRLLRTRPTELDCRTLSAEALDGLQARVREVLLDLVGAGELRTPSGDPFGAQQGYEAFRARFDEVVAGAIKAERRRLVVDVDQARGERVKALEDRVSSLTDELKRAEEQLAQPELLQATSSPFTVPPKGLDHADPFFMWRWRLLNWVFLENCELQGRSIHGELKDPAPADLLSPMPSWLERDLAGTPSASESTATSEAPDAPEARDRRAWLREQLDPEPAPTAEPTAAPARAWLDETTARSSPTPVASRKEPTLDTRQDDGKSARRAWLYEALSTSVSPTPDEEGA